VEIHDMLEVIRTNLTKNMIAYDSVKRP